MRQLGNRRAYISQMSPGLNRCHTPLQTLFGNRHQVFGFFVHAPNFKHAGSIAVIIIQNRRNIDIYDITGTKCHFLRRNAVTHHIVYGRAHAFGKTAEIQWCRDAPMGNREIIHNPVDFFRRHTFSDMLRHLVQHSGI